MNKKKLKYRVTYLEMNRKPSFDWPKNLKHKLSILLAEDFPAWYFFFFYKQVGKNYYWTDWLRKSEDEIDEFVNDKTHKKIENGNIKQTHKHNTSKKTHGSEAVFF